MGSLLRRKKNETNTYKNISTQALTKITIYNFCPVEIKIKPLVIAMQNIRSKVLHAVKVHFS